MNVLIIVKNIDGGIGTFLNELSEINKKNEILRRLKSAAPHLSENYIQVQFISKLKFAVFLKSFNKKEKVEIKVVSLEKPSYRNFNSIKTVYFRDSDFYPKKYSLSIKNFITFFTELICLRNEVATFRPQIIMGIDLRANLLALFTKIFFARSAKVILSTHIDLSSLTLKISSKPVKFFLKFWISLLYSMADALVAVSKDLRIHLIKDFGIHKDVFTIYNGLKSKKSGIKRFPSGFIKIVSVGRLNDQKNFELLIKTAAVLKQMDIDFEVSIAGDGPEQKHLKSLIKKLNLSRNIKLLGWVKNISTLYRKGDIFVSSSDFEGFGYVLIEAMSYGLPVVSTNAPYGPSEILGNGKYGLLSPVGDEQKLAQNILLLSKNKSKFTYFSRQSVIRSTYFSSEKMLSNYRKLFYDLSK